jgi:hypothetical protein
LAAGRNVAPVGGNARHNVVISFQRATIQYIKLQYVARDGEDQ